MKVATADQLRTWTGDGFTIKQTPHFNIAYDGSYEHVRPLSGRAEGTYAAVTRMGRLMDLPLEPPGHRLPIVFFDRFADYAVRAAELGQDPNAVAGFYHSRTNVAVFFNALTRPDVRAFTDQIEQWREELMRLRGAGSRGGTAARRQDLLRQLTAWRIQRDRYVERINRVVIQHEVAHQILFNLGLHNRQAMNPGWLVEGLACQFEVSQTAGHGGLGVVNRDRLTDLRTAFGLEDGSAPPGPAQRRAAFSSGTLLPLRALIGHARATARHDNPNLSSLYAECWSLVLYLHRQRRDALVAYLNAVRGRPPEFVSDEQHELAAFETAFGPIDDAFQNAWLDFVFGLKPRAGG